MKQTLGHLIALSNFTDKDSAILAGVSETTSLWVDDVVKAFYDALFAYAPTAAVFREGERPDREKTLEAWYLEVTAGKIDEAFWKHQWFVGLVHIKRQVVNSFMIGMLSRVQNLFSQKCLDAFGPEKALEVIGAFNRVTSVTSGLVAEGYLQGYKDAVGDITGMKDSLIDRMALVAVDRLLERAQIN